MLLLVANGEPPPPRLLLSLANQCRGLIAVDGGLKACDSAGLTPDFILGDFDSISEERYPVFDKEINIHYLGPWHDGQRDEG